MEKQISIIIPTYNMEKYIGRCLDSLLIPEIDQVEVLVVNDGSKDRSSEIAHSYAERYPDSIRVIDKPNGNYGSCINTALPLCTGRYVKVLDADDTFDTEAFSKYVKELSNRNEDVVINDYSMVFEDKPTIFKPTFAQMGYEPYKSYKFSEAYQYITSDLHMHCVAYKHAYIISLKYRQTEGVSYTDNEWIFAPIGLAKSFAFMDTGFLYRYLLGRDGQTVDPSLSLMKINDHFEVIKALATLYGTICVNGQRRQFLITRLASHAQIIYYRIIKSTNSDALNKLANFDTLIKDISPELYGILDKVIYSPHIPYRYVKEFRKSGYSSKFRISRHIKIGADIIHFISKIKRRFLQK